VIHPHAGLLQVVLELVAFGVIAVVVTGLLLEGHRAGRARLARARRIEEGRILAGIAAAAAVPDDALDAFTVITVVPRPRASWEG
jgi:hypothetical protein